MQRSVNEGGNQMHVTPTFSGGACKLKPGGGLIPPIALAEAAVQSACTGSCLGVDSRLRT